jgi:hypothetical protein
VTPDPALERERAAELDLMGRARQLRRDAGVSLAVMADHCRVPRSLLTVWERDPAAGQLPEHAAACRRWVAALDRPRPGRPKAR